MKTIYQVEYIDLIAQLVLVRKDLQQTQLQLATKLGKPQSYIAKVEGCERKLDVIEFIQWCHALNKVPSEYIQHIEQQLKRNMTRKPPILPIR